MNAKPVLKTVLPVVATAAGVAVMLLLIRTRPKPPHQERTADGVLVTTQTLTKDTHEVSVVAQGRVTPARQVVLAPEVSGRVQWQSPELVPGGRFDAGAAVVRIDPRDYRLQLEARRADVQRAQLELQLERGRQQVAAREWEAFGEAPSSDGEATGLVLRQPQLRTAQVALEAAQSSAEQARLALNRTTVRAPFAAMVLNENAELGQLVGPSSPLATLVGTDEFWVEVSLPVEHLASIQIEARDGEGSRAQVWQEVAGHRIERTGRALRVLPDVDPVGAMARVLVAIEDPLGLAQQGGEDPLPMLLGTTVTVEIAAEPLRDVIAVPRQAVRQGDRAFVMRPDGTLGIRDLVVAWRTEDALLVRDGVREGEHLITSRIAIPVEGMALRTAGERVETSSADPSEARP